MNRIKFDKEKLKKYLKEHKNRVTKIFSNEENLKNLENNNFINLYSNVKTNNSSITATLLLSDIDFLSHLNKIPYCCFDQLNMIESITIPNSVTSIGTRAFQDCTGLTSVTIDSGVTSIGDRAFYQCTGLTSITIPSSVTSIGNYAFCYCYELKNIHYLGNKKEWLQISCSDAFCLSKIEEIKCIDGTIKL